MALRNEIDSEGLRERMALWLEKQIPGSRNVQVGEMNIPQESGLSALTIIFDASWQADGAQAERRLVARAMSEGGGVFPKSSLETEHHVLSALSAHSDVAVPAPFGLETKDLSICGMPFMVMDFAAGRVPRDDPPYTVSGWVMQLSDQKRRRLSENAFAELVKLHSVNPEELGLTWLRDVPMGAPAMSAKLDAWEEYYRWAAEGIEYPLIDHAFDWLRGNIPEETPPVISWGDGRIGNMIIGDDMEVSALVDWEMVGLGSREVDIGWWIFTTRFHTDIINVPLPAGFLTEAELLERYEQLSGYRPRNIDYYITFAGLRLSLVMKRLGNMMIANGQLPPDASMPYSNPASHLLADCLHVDRPAAGMMDFVGNR